MLVSQSCPTLCHGAPHGSTLVFPLLTIFLLLEMHSQCQALPNTDDLQFCCIPVQIFLLSHPLIQTDLIDYSVPGSSVHGILQARILEWVAISFSRGSSQPRDQNHISYVSCIGCMLRGKCEKKKERKKSMRERELPGDGTWLQKWEHRAGHKWFRNTMYRSVRRRKYVHQMRN